MMHEARGNSWRKTLGLRRHQISPQGSPQEERTKRWKHKNRRIGE
jgi:hypothetical protein